LDRTIFHQALRAIGQTFHLSHFINLKQARMVKLGQQIPLLAKASHCFWVTHGTRFQDIDCYITAGCGLESVEYQGCTGLINLCYQLVLADRSPECI